MPSDLQLPGNAIESFVLPLALVEQTGPNNSRPVVIAGTGFLVANGRGLGLTAGHVAKDLEAAARENVYPAAAFRLLDGDWTAVRVQRFEHHATDDVALFRLPEQDLYSRYTLSPDRAPTSTETMLWGYPDDIRHDRADHGVIIADLMYSAGHIRRNVNYELPITRVPGRHFYELSNPAGSCCSGSPVSMRTSADPWQAVGVYVGERRNERNTFSVGYATRTDVLADQWPQLFAGDLHSLAELCALT